MGDKLGEVIFQEVTDITEVVGLAYREHAGWKKQALDGALL